MTAVTRLQLLPAPGTTSGVPAGPAPAPDDQRVKPVLPARAVHSGRPDYRSQSEIEPRGEERRLPDRRIADRRTGQARLGYGAPEEHASPRRRATPGEATNGRLIAFSRLSSLPFMVQVLGQEAGSISAALTPQTSLTGHRDASLLGSDIYRKAGGEPEFLPDTATLVRLAV